MPSEKPPLRLEYEPDDYLCTWTVPDGRGGAIELPGNLEVQPNRPPRGSIYGSVPLQLDEGKTGSVSASFPQHVEVPVLSGTLANGGSLLLLDASLEYWSMGHGYVSGSAALLGHGDGSFGWFPTRADPTPSGKVPLVSAVKFQITGLDVVLGTTPIKSVKIPGIHPANPRDVWSATVNPEATMEWAADGHVLSIGYDSRMRAADRYQFRLAFSPVATIDLQQGVPLRMTFVEFVEPLRRIISIATGSSQDLTYVSVEIDGQSGKHQVFGTGINQDPFESSSARAQRTKSAISAMPDEISLLDLVMKWRHYTSEHHPLVETYGAMLHARDQHPRSLFLLLIQALEGLYGHQTKASYDERKAKHLVKRENILGRLKLTLGPKPSRFLKDNLLKNPPTNLESALKAMVTGLPVDTMGRLGETSLIKEAMLDPAAPTTTASALRVVRNNLAHRKRGYDVYSLNQAVVILESIVRAHSLRALGCPDHVIARVFNED